MKTFETTEEVLVGAREVHARACELFSQLSAKAEDEEARVLLSFLTEHESKMAEKFTSYLADAPQPLLRSWTQYSLEVEPKKFFRDLSVHNEMSVEEIAAVSCSIESYLVGLFEEMSTTAVTSDARLVFSSLMSMENEASPRLCAC